MVKLRVALLVLQCAVCLTIRVPVNWDNDSDNDNNEQFSSVKPTETVQATIPKEYFQYTAVKPQFAIDIATTHGVQAPEQLYSAYPIKPYTGVEKPSLGQHHLLDPQKESYHPYQNFVNKSHSLNYVKPTITSFEVFHPYKAEEPYLQEIYRDPVLNKIRDDLRDSKNRLQKYENDAGEENIENGEYLESPDQIDHKHQPQKNIQAKFEIHRPLRRPIYYRPPMKHLYRENILNQKFKHPLNQNYVKVTPMHYRPVKNHLQRLRQQHAIKFDDEHNEYPQLLPPETYAEKPDGYDIYERGKENYIKLRNNLDESINKAAQENRQPNSQNLELQDNEEYNALAQNNEDEFVPIKNYAQVRKTETTKHLPRERAFQDADSFDEIKNAPRLREAIKSTKAQIVYSEEGYEDSAYDHAGEQKHASDHEAHGGHLKENESSRGKYKIPSVSTSYDDEKGSAYRDQLLDGRKWQDDKQASEDATDSQDYFEDEYVDAADTDIHSDSSNHEEKKENNNSEEKKEYLKEKNIKASKKRNKRQGVDENLLKSDIDLKTKLAAPKINLGLIKSSNKQNKSLITKSETKAKDDLKLKYPYYFTEIAGVNKDSPLRYAENLNFIPKKSHGGTEFYESRSAIACPEVEDVDPVPDGLKKGENPEDKSDKDAEFKKFNEKQRLKGLGDKIDCFKAKYFGENPLDSPFFKEEIILGPKPIPIPSINIFNRQQPKKELLQISPTEKNWVDNGMFAVLEGIYVKNNKSGIFQNVTIPLPEEQPKSDTLLNSSFKLSNLNSNQPIELSYKLADINTKYPVISRKRRANSFVYEPYKIIKEGLIQDSKKTTTTSNISPLIKQLQSSRIIDRGFSKHNKEELPMKRNTNFKVYQDIDKLHRQKYLNADTKNQFNSDYDKRRGEPRYDLGNQNHKSYYTPVENKTAITLEEYEEKTGNTVRPGTKTISDREFLMQSPSNNSKKTNSFINMPQKVSSYTDTQISAASNTIRNILRTTTLRPSSRNIQRSPKKDNRNSNDEYVEYDDDNDDDADEENKHENTTTQPTTTTTKTRPSRRRYVPEKIVSTTDKVGKSYNVDEEFKTKPMLELVTRFRDSSSIKSDTLKNENIKKENFNNESNPPKYREKKKKVTKSTLVTDTKSYGEDDDDMQKEDIDAMIGVKHTVDDYLPSYEKEVKGRDSKLVEKGLESEEYDREKKLPTKEHHDDEDDEEDDEEYEDDEDEEEGDDEDDEDDEEDDINDKNDEDDVVNSNNTEKNQKEITTATSIQNTTPLSVEISVTTQSTSSEIEPTPTILRKKIEIHKELPVNKSSPHTSQFKQDIKEIEIIKEIAPKPRRNHPKNSEVLDLYKDENLAKDINQLGGVEIFKEDLDLKSGPRHGGNYRSIEPQNIKDDISAVTSKHNTKQSDIETSQTETKKRIDSLTILPNIRRNFRTRIAQDPTETKNEKLTTVEEEDYTPNKTSKGRNRKMKQLSESRNAKLTELVEEINVPKPLHGGNLKLPHNRGRSRDSKNAKYIELDDNEETETPKMHGGNFKSYGNKRNDMHGGNYKSARIVQENKSSVSDQSRNAKQLTKGEKNTAAAMLSGFARAVPILTTTPVYILDPSKRMYYYVDT